jgi:hypothetical protein
VGDLGEIIWQGGRNNFDEVNCSDSPKPFLANVEHERQSFDNRLASCRRVDGFVWA